MSINDGPNATRAMGLIAGGGFQGSDDQEPPV